MNFDYSNQNINIDNIYQQNNSKNNNQISFMKISDNENPFINNQSIENEENFGNKYEMIDKYISKDNFAFPSNNQSFAKTKSEKSNLSNVKNSKISNDSLFSDRLNKTYSSHLKKLIKQGYERINNNDNYNYNENNVNSKENNIICDIDTNSNFNIDNVRNLKSNNILQNSLSNPENFNNISDNKLKLTNVTRFNERAKGTEKTLFQIDGSSNKFLLDSNNYEDPHINIKRKINEIKIYGGKKDRVDAHNKYRLYWQATPILFKDKPNEIVTKKVYIDEVKIPKEQKIMLIKRKEIRKPTSHMKKF